MNQPVKPCRSCGAMIEWALSARGRPVPLDVGPVKDGNLVLDAGVARARRKTDTLPPRRTHFVTCPNAATWRKQ